MSNDNATTVFTGYANEIKKIKPEQITWAAYQLLTAEQKAAKRYLITDYPGADTNDKADKVAGATSGNLASLDASGNLADSGKKASDFVAASAVGTAAAKNVPASGNASTTEVVMGNDTRLSDSRTPTAHNHSAADINSSSTLGAQVKANATSVQTLGTSQVRNIYAGTSDMTAGTTALTTGDIYVVYE